MRATADLLSNYQHIIEDLTLITGGAGVFDVIVDGQKLFSKHETGRHADDGEILQLFAELVGPGVKTYGT